MSALRAYLDRVDPRSLRALDYVRPGFSSRFDTAAHAEQALTDLGAAHKAALAASQKEAARQAIVENVQRREGLRQATAADKADVSALLVERKANDRAEGQADRAGVASSIADRRASDRTLDAQSAADMRAGKSAARGSVSAAKATPAGQFGKVAVNAIASTEVENAVGSFLHTGTGGATRMRGLVSSVSGDPKALAGLRKAGADWLVRTHMNADGTLSGAKLIFFINSNRDTLGELYPHDQRTTFGALARDAEGGMRWRTSTAIKGGSDSAKNFLAALDKVEKSGGRHVSVGFVAVEAISLGVEKLESVGWKVAGIADMGTAVAYLGNTLRQVGIRNTADLYREAMANPDLARAFISRMLAAADGNALHNLARVLKRGLIVGPMLTGETKPAGAR